MKNLLLVLLSVLSFGAIAQVDSTKDQLIISGRILNMHQKYTKVLIIEGYSEADTIHTIHLNKKNGKFELPSLDVTKDYTIVFIHGDRIKSLYVVAAGPDAVATYFMKLTVDMDFDYGDGDVLGSAEYNDRRDAYKMYYSYSLKKRK